jgi:thiol-disulfide isomerase/thioredoxin
MSKRVLVFLVAAAVALAAGAWLAHQRYAPQTPPAETLAALWAMRFADLQGQPQPLSQWRGKVVVLNFWASWCAPCREEMPDFDALRRRFHARGVEFVGIAIDNETNVARFLQDMPVSYPILIGEGAALAVARQLGNTAGALPYTLVIDRDGKIVLSRLGRLSYGELDASLRRQLP